MNNVVLMGRLTRDPRISMANTISGQMAVAHFSLAVDRRFKKEGEQQADFISCVAFGKTAEFVEKYLHQGSKVCLSGRIQTGSYKNKDGATVYTTDIVVENIEFAESRAAQDQGGNASADSGNFMDIPDSVDDEGLPFK